MSNAKRAPFLALVHCSISRSPSRIAKRCDRTTSNMLLDSSGFSDVVVNEVDLGKLDQHRLAVSHLELQFTAAADPLLRGHTVGHLGESSHEFIATARDDEGLKAIGPEIGEQL